MTFGSLFTGIGGLDLGLERAGMTCKWQVEIDPFCQKVLMKHWPEVPKYGDIQKIAGDELERVDLIAGGFPCNDTSVAGLRGGITGDESARWFDMRRIIRALRPASVLVENPTGLLVFGIATVLGDLAACGYDAEWNCIPAAAMGAAHRRDRIFLLAYPCGSRLQRHQRGVMEGEQSFAGYSARRSSAFPEIANRQDGALEPWVLRDIHGVPHRMDRVRSLGRAVVPQVAEWIGRRIMEAAK